MTAIRKKGLREWIHTGSSMRGVSLSLLCILGSLLTMSEACAGYSLAFGHHLRTELMRFVEAGDVTGDGIADIVALSGEDVCIYETLPEGGFAEARRYRYTNSGWADYAYGLALADLNHDGIKDIVVGGAGTLDLVVIKSNRLAPLQMSVEFLADGDYDFGKGLAILDIEGDGYEDVVQAISSSFASSSVRLWHGGRRYGNHPHSLIQKIDRLPSNVEGFNEVFVRDMNADNFPDLVVSSNLQGTFSVYLHDGAGGYTTPPQMHNPSACCKFALGDFNNDGRPDVVSSWGSNAPVNLEIQLMQQSGQFGPPILLATGDRPGIMRATDIDADGDDDLMVMHHGHSPGLYLQDENGLQPQASSPSGETFAIGDLNADGCNDVVYAGQSSDLLVYYGTGCLAPAHAQADLAVSLSATASVAVVGIANAQGSVPIASPLLKLDITVRTGHLQTGVLPPGCALQTQTASAVRVECLAATLAPGSSTVISIPLAVQAIGTQDKLTVSVQAGTDTPERSMANNRAWKQISLRPVVKRKSTNARLQRVGQK